MCEVHVYIQHVMCNVCRCLLRCILIHNLLQQNAEQLMGLANDLQIANCALVTGFKIEL